MIHVIGDSHTAAFTLSIFHVHHMGSPTAFNLRNKHSTYNSNRQLLMVLDEMDKDVDSLILCYGEIDCRIHIYYQFKKQQEKVSISQLIDNTIESYGEVLRQVEAKGVNFYVYGTPAATHQGNEYNYPWYATPEIHVRIYREFNEKLKHHCQQNGYKFLDIYSKTVGPDGHTHPAFMKDSIHFLPIIQLLVLDELDCITPMMREDLKYFTWDRDRITQRVKPLNKGSGQIAQT